MPGFAIGQGPGTAPYMVQPPKTVYYSYAWKIFSLFGTPTASYSPIVYAQSATLPTFTANSDIVQGSSYAYKYADNITWEDVRITFYDASALSTSLTMQLQEWRNRVWTKERGIGAASAPNENTGGYKKTSEIHNFSYNDNRRIIWTLENSWPQSIRYGDLTYTSSDVRLVEVVVTYDSAIERDDYHSDLV